MENVEVYDGLPILLDIFEKRWRKPIFVFAKDMIINASATTTQI